VAVRRFLMPMLTLHLLIIAGYMSRPPLAWHESTGTIGWDMTCLVPRTCLHRAQLLGPCPASCPLAIARWGAHVRGDQIQGRYVAMQLADRGPRTMCRGVAVETTEHGLLLSTLATSPRRAMGCHSCRSCGGALPRNLAHNPASPCRPYRKRQRRGAAARYTGG
jgi:hypothetical protein